MIRLVGDGTIFRLVRDGTIICLVGDKTIMIGIPFQSSYEGLGRACWRRLPNRSILAIPSKGSDVRR